MAVIDTSLRKESRDRYLTYALSVVSGRALPDVRDGLKPVQRRILYAMFHNLNLKPTGSHKKSAAVVGEVLAKFHPHGDIACYEAMVRMAQDFSYRYPLVEGQGNFGSLDGDSPAAYRYTEAKLAPIALEVLGEIHEETVDFKDNFDASTVEPEVLPSKIPNLLCNGATGIAVGLATNIPPHNLGDVVKALIALSNDPSLTIAKLAGILKGPDFPTGCEIVNSQAELSEMYQSGRGVVRMRGEWSVEEGNRGKRAIIVTSIPYALNKSMLVERIAQLIIDKKVPQLQDVRDESTDQVRVVIELATGADPDVAMAYVFKHTPLESNFNVNLTALVPTDAGSCRPQLLSLKEMLQYFLEFRYEVVERRLQFERKNLLERIHILEGFVKIFDKLDEAIKIVRASKGRSDAAGKLAKRFKLTEIQSYAIVDMRIYQLSQTNIKELRDELKEKKARVAEIDKILKSKKRIEGLVRGDLEKVAADYSDRRRCKIVKSVEEIELNEADYVVEEEVFAIVTSDGWLKKVRQTNELGSTRLREGDSILQAHPLTTLDSVAFFTNLGTLYVLRVSDFPSSSGYGSPIQKLLKFKDGEKVIESFGIRRSENAQQSLDGGEYGHLVDDGSKLVMVTQNGIGFAIELESLETIKRNGKRVMKLRAKDTVAAVCHLDKTISFFTQSGSGLAVSMKEIPVRAQAAVGVALMGVRDKDKIVSAVGYARKTSLNVLLGTGKTKSIQSSTVTSGRRGLKGTKVVSRGEIVRVERG